MELQLTSEQEARLAQIATKNGTVPERLVTEAILRLLEVEAHASGNVSSKVGKDSLELPVLHLGAMGPLHRREIYDDAR